MDVSHTVGWGEQSNGCELYSWAGWAEQWMWAIQLGGVSRATGVSYTVGRGEQRKGCEPYSWAGWAEKGMWTIQLGGVSRERDVSHTVGRGEQTDRLTLKVVNVLFIIRRPLSVVGSSELSISGWLTPTAGNCIRKWEFTLIAKW